jgi:RNA polymerase sigma factor (sigma-70 family)
VIRRLSNRLGVQEVGALSDADLLGRFLDHRDEAAFEVLVWRHGTMVLGVCQRLLDDAHAAEDAFQATFLALAREAGRVGRRESVGGWLYRVAYRVALKAKARTARRAACERRHPGPCPQPPPGETIEPDLRPVLDDEINRLPARYRQPVVLCYLEGKTNVEAAQQLGCPPGTVATRLAWARERLRRRLTRRGLAPAGVALAAGLEAGTARASLASPLVEETVRASLAWAAGSGAAAAASGRAVTLAKGAVRLLFLSRLKKAGLILAAAAMVVAAAGVPSYRLLAGKGGREIVRENPAPAAPPVGGKAGRPRLTTADVLGQARDAARAVEEPTERVHVLVQLAVAQHEAGDRAGGLKTLQDALAVVTAIEEESPKGLALSVLASAEVRLGDAAGALRVADVVENPNRKNHLRFLIACRQAESDDVAGALRTVAAMTDDQKDNALIAVAAAQARAGDVKAALQTADGLRHQPLARASALEEIALAQAKAGDRAAAGASLQEALRLHTATLAQEEDRRAARARVAVLQAQVGDVAAALASAAALPKEGDGEDREAALAGIAAEQARAGDLRGALRTLDGVTDPARKVSTLVDMAATEAAAGHEAASRETLQAARALADSLQDAGKREACRWTIARSRLAAGDPEPARAWIRAHPKGVQVGWLSLDIARAEQKAGNRAAAVATFRQAWDAGAALQDPHEDPMGVQTLAPRWALVKGALLQQTAAALAAAGEEDDALARASKLDPPFIRSQALLGVALGLRKREGAAGKGRPPER